MINIVIGKPGSGKTYHIVRYLYEVLTELLKKSTIERKIYTNISVNIDEFNSQLSKDFKTEIHVENILVTLEPEDLKYDSRRITEDDKIEKRVAGKSFYSVAATSQAFFWNRFEDNALIVIDEIQKYLSTVKEESESERQSLIEYFSLHRHKRHDWFFITQNLLSLPVEIRRVSEKVYNIFNAKSMSLGFPINIPLRDVEILLAGFNISRQIYRVREGYLESTYRVAYEDSVEVVVMEKRIFALYQTHTQLKDNAAASIFRGDSTLPFDLGKGQRWRAVKWFLGKHGFHLGLKIFVVVWFVGGIFTAINKYSAKYKQAKAELLPVADAVIQDDVEILDDSSLAPVQSLADHASAPALDQNRNGMIIYNNVVKINGVTYRVGDCVGARRIVKISAREGVDYEAPEIDYIRGYVLLDELDRLRRR